MHLTTHDELCCVTAGLLMLMMGAECSLEFAAVCLIHRRIIISVWELASRGGTMER